MQTVLMGDILVAYSGAAFVPWPRAREMREQNEERKPVCLSFVSDLAEVAAKIAKLTKTDPARAIALHETLLAGCCEKAEELDGGRPETTKGRPTPWTRFA